MQAQQGSLSAPAALIFILTKAAKLRGVKVCWSLAVADHAAILVDLEWLAEKKAMTAFPVSAVFPWASLAVCRGRSA